MTRIAQQVSRAIRILRGNRDESARASHLVVEKDLLMTYETDLLGQAEREKYFQSTFFERKTMSTKTAFKRVALVAAAALAFGGISAVSANAATSAEWTITNSNGAVGVLAAGETATQIAGVANYVSIVPTTGSIYFTVSGGTTTTGTTSGTATAGTAVNIATPVVGTITVTGYTITSGAASTTATSTVTITVLANLAGAAYGASTINGNSGSTAPDATTDAAFAVSTPADGSVAANFTLQEMDNSTTPVALTSNWKAITATVTNGLLSATLPDASVVPDTTYIAIAATSLTSGVVHFRLKSISGLYGTSTVTFAVNGVVVKTYSAIFTGAAVKIVLTAVNPVIAVGTAAANLTAGITANTNALEIQEFDANNNAVTVATGGITIAAAASTTASAGSASVAVGSLAVNFLAGLTSGTALSSTVAGVSLAGVAAGTTTFTATDATNTLTSAAVTVRVSSATPTSVVYSTDLGAYPAGGIGTLTVTVSDAAGTVPAGVYALATGAATSSFAFAVAPATAMAGSVTLNDSGVATASFNAPLSDGSVSVTGTAATGVTLTPASFTVANGASDAANAATDAANEATDAANAATDAANAAADSADAATQAAQDAGAKADAALAAVTALSQQVTSVLAKIAGLAASLARIIKKVKA